MLSARDVAVRLERRLRHLMTTGRRTDDGGPTVLPEESTLGPAIHEALAELEMQGVLRTPIRTVVRALVAGGVGEEEIVAAAKIRASDATKDGGAGLHGPWFGVMHRLLQVGDRQGLWTTSALRSNAGGLEAPVADALATEGPEVVLAARVAAALDEGGEQSDIGRAAATLVEGWRPGAILPNLSVEAERPEDSKPDEGATDECEELLPSMFEESEAFDLEDDDLPDLGEEEEGLDQELPEPLAEGAEESSQEGALADVLKIDLFRLRGGKTEDEESGTEKSDGAAEETEAGKDSVDVDEASQPGIEEDTATFHLPPQLSIDTAAKLEQANVNQWCGGAESPTDGWYGPRGASYELWLKRSFLTDDEFEEYRQAGLLLGECRGQRAKEWTYLIYAGNKPFRDVLAIDAERLRDQLGEQFERIHRNWDGSDRRFEIKKVIGREPTEGVGEEKPERARGEVTDHACPKCQEHLTWEIGDRGPYFACGKKHFYVQATAEGVPVPPRPCKKCGRDEYQTVRGGKLMWMHRCKGAGTEKEPLAVVAA